MKIKVSDLQKILNEAIVYENLYRQGYHRIIAESAEGVGKEATENLDPQSITALEDMIQSASPEAWALWKNMAGSKMMLRDKNKNAVKGIIKKRAEEGTLPELFHEYGVLMDQMEFENRGFFKKLGKQGPAFIAGSALYAAVVVALGMKNPKMFSMLIPAAYSLISANNTAAKINASEEKIQRTVKTGDYKKPWQDDEFEITDTDLKPSDDEEKDAILRLISAKFGSEQDPNKLSLAQKAALASLAEKELSGEVRDNLLKTREDAITSIGTNAGQQMKDAEGVKADQRAPQAKPSDFDADGNLTPEALAQFEEQQAANQAQGDAQQASTYKLSDDDEENEVLSDIIDLADEDNAVKEGRINEIALTMGAGWVTWAVIEATYAKFGGAISRSLAGIPSLKGLASAFGAGSLSGLVMAILKTIFDKLGKDEFKMNLIEWLNSKGFKEESLLVDSALSQDEDTEENPSDVIEGHHENFTKRKSRNIVNEKRQSYLNQTSEKSDAKEKTMNITEAQLRRLVRESLMEEGMEDIMGAIGKHGSKILTRPAGIIAKALGRGATSGDSKGYEGRIDANVEGLEALVGKALSMVGKGMDISVDQLEKAAYKVMPDLHPDEIEKLHQEIEDEVAKHGGAAGFAKKRMGDAATSIKGAAQDATAQIKTAFAENTARHENFDAILKKALNTINEEYIDISGVDVDNLSPEDAAIEFGQDDDEEVAFQDPDLTDEEQYQQLYGDPDGSKATVYRGDTGPDWSKLAGIGAAAAAGAAGYAAGKAKSKKK